MHKCMTTREDEKLDAYQTQILAQVEFQWIQDSTYWQVHGKLQHVTIYKRSGAMTGVHGQFYSLLEHPSSLIWRIKKHGKKKIRYFHLCLQIHLRSADREQ